MKNKIREYGLYTTGNPVVLGLGKWWCSGSRMGTVGYVDGDSDPAGTLCELLRLLDFMALTMIDPTSSWF
jgi:hypothetical protein